FVFSTEHLPECIDWNEGLEGGGFLWGHLLRTSLHCGSRSSFQFFAQSKQFLFWEVNSNKIPSSTSRSWSSDMLWSWGSQLGRWLLGAGWKLFIYVKSVLPLVE